MLKHTRTSQRTENESEVILLHGFLESPSIWEGFIQATADKNIHCTNIHLPNHLMEEQGFYLNDLSQQAEALHQTLIETKVSAPILIGHSLGGYLALAFMEKYPEFTSGLVLVNSTCLADSNERKIQRTRAINLIEKNPSAFIQMAIKNLFLPASLTKHSTEINQLISDAKNLPIAAIQASLEAMRDRKDRTEVLRNFKKKKLFIYGTNDPLIPVKDSLKAITESSYPSVALETGHMAWLEDKEKLNKVLLEFIVG